MSPQTDILLVADGTSRHIERLVAALVDSDLRVALAGFEAGDIDGVRFIRLGSLPRSADRRYFLAIPRLARLTMALEPAILHAHYLSSYGVLAAVARRAAYPTGGGPSLIQTVWGTDVLVTAKRSFRRLLARAALRSAQVVTGDSDELALEVRRLAPEVPWRTFIFGPPGELFQEVGRTRRKTIVSIRALIPEMRVSLIAEAFMQARQSGDLSGYRLAIAGDGPERGAMASRFTDDAVQIMGHLQPSALWQLLQASEAVVSIPRTDGTSASLLEAMAAGALPIVNALPANLQWVKPEVGVIVSRDPSVGELARAMAGIAQRSVDRSSIRDAVQPALWETQIHELVGLYERVGGWSNASVKSSGG